MQDHPNGSSAEPRSPAEAEDKPKQPDGISIAVTVGEEFFLYKGQRALIAVVNQQNIQVHNNLSPPEIAALINTLQHQMTALMQGMQAESRIARPEKNLILPG